jgi:pimeloyl-ACP methyl ester carboxylesterase
MDINRSKREERDWLDTIMVTTCTRDGRGDVLSSMRRISTLLLLCLCAFAVRAGNLADYTGNYSLKGRIVAVAEWEVDAEAPHVLAFTDFVSGRFGMLTEINPDEFVLHEGVMAGSESARLRFTRKGDAVSGLTFTERGKLPKIARRLPHRRVEMTSPAATLLLPPGKGPFPAIVIVPAGRVGRMAAATFPNFFLSEGFAVLMYDGRREAAPFETSAADAIAAVDSIRNRTDIDRKKIGLWGHSQGGWLSIIAAAQSPGKIGFVIDHSGMFVPAWQQELYRLASEALADGIAPVEVARAVLFEAQLMEVAQSGKGWGELISSLRDAKGKWIDLVYKPSSLEELQRFWRDDFSFDPRPFAGRVRQPVLALFGGLDRSTPIESAAQLKQAMPPENRLTEMIFPTANHAFLEARTGGNAEIPKLTRFVPGMFDSMRKWLALQ